MTQATIVYYGPIGLEAQVLERYVTALGHPMQRVPDWKGLLHVLREHPESIPVVATEQPLESVDGMLREINAGRVHSQVPIYLLCDFDECEPMIEGVRIIGRHFRLKRLLHELAGWPA